MATLSGDGSINNQHSTSPEDCLSKAAEAASRVNALLIAKGKLKPSQLGCDTRKKAPNGKTRFDAEVEINDAPIICRDILTKNLSQDEISKKTGAFVTTKGRYISAEQRRLIDINQDRPLYLYIQAETEANVQAAVSEINKIIQSHGGVVNQTRGSTIALRAPPDFCLTDTDGHQPNSLTLNSLPAPKPSNHMLPRYVPASNAVSIASQVQFLTEKLYIGLEHAPPTFDVRSKVLGSEGNYLQHIHATSGAVVTLRGRNSGYLDVETGQESTEPMYIHLQHISVDGLENAKNLANHLIKTVQNEYSQFQRQLALQAAPMVSSVVSHTVQPGSLVTMQNVVPNVMNYQSAEQPVMQLSSSPSVQPVGPPMTLVMSQQPPFSHSKAPMYVQSGPHSIPVSSSVINQVPPPSVVGYNSLTSHGVEVIRQPITLSRPLMSLQPVTREVFANGGQPAMTVNPHIANGIDTPTATLQTVDVSTQPPPPVTPASLHAAPPYTGPISYSTHTPVSVVSLPPPTLSVPPPIMVSSSAPSIGEQVILVSHAITTVTDSLSHQPAATPIYPVAASSSAQQPSHLMGAKPAHETMAYIVQRPVEGQVVCIEQPPHQTAQPPPPDVSIPPPNAAGHLAAVINKPQAATIAVNEYGQPLAPLEVMCVQPVPPPSADMMNHQGSALSQSVEPAPVCITARTTDDHCIVATGPTVAHNVTQYPPPSHISNAAGVVNPLPPASTTQIVIPNLMDLEIQSTASHIPSHRPPPPPPPIEPPPHLADGYRSNKRAYNRDKPYYQVRSEIRPPYRGSGAPYSAIVPSSNGYDRPPRYKRAHCPRYSPPSQP